MGRAFEESKRAYESGDGASAKQLSEEGKRHKTEMENLNSQASDWIYRGKTSFNVVIMVINIRSKQH